MSPELIAAGVLFGPAAAAGSVAAVACWRRRGEFDAALAVFAEHFATRSQDAPPESPPDGGMPTPAASPTADTTTGTHLAEVIPFPTRDAA